MNKGNSMRQQQYASGRQPSRICKFLLLLVGVKLCLLTMLLVEPFIPAGFLPNALLSPAHNAATQSTQPVQSAQQTADATQPAQPLVQTGQTALSIAAAPTQTVNNTTPATHPQATAQVSPEAASVQDFSGLRGGVAYAAEATKPTQQAQPQSPQNRMTMEALNRKQEELNRKEQELKALQTELNKRLEEMQILEVRLQTMLKDAEQTKDAKYRHLVDVLSNMKSRQAAEVLETLDEKIAVRVLAGMRGRQAGEILTYAKPTKAARLAEQLSRMQMPFE